MTSQGLNLASVCMFEVKGGPFGDFGCLVQAFWQGFCQCFNQMVHGKRPNRDHPSARMLWQ
jgi:hypothetical protein